MSVQSIHDEVGAVCGEDFGIGISYDAVRAGIARSIHELIAAGANENWPTTRDGVGISVYVDPARFNLVEAPGRQGFDLTVDFVVNLHVIGAPAKLLAEVDVSFSNSFVEVKARPEIGGKAGLVIKDRGVYSWKPRTPRPADFLANLVEAGFVVDAEPDEGEYLRFEFSAFTFQPDVFLRGLLDLAWIPPIREGLKTFRLMDPVKISYSDNYLLLHSEEVEFEDRPCPFGISSVRQISVSEVDANAAAGAGDRKEPAEQKFEVRFDRDLDPFADMAAARRNVGVLTENLGPSPVVYYYQKKNILDYSFSRVKPSVTYSDRNSFGPIYWYYGITAALKSLTLSFQQVAPSAAKIVLETPLRLLGQAGASIRIGCVDYRVLGVQCEGDIDPLRIAAAAGVTLSLNTATAEIFLTTTLEDARPTLRWTTGFGFPFDQIATKLINWIMRKEVRKFIGRPTDVLRVPLSDFLDLALNYDHNYARIQSHAKPDSLLLALDSAREG